MKECCNCKHCYHGEYCALIDELCLIAGHCALWSERE